MNRCACEYTPPMNFVVRITHSVSDSESDEKIVTYLSKEPIWPGKHSVGLVIPDTTLPTNVYVVQNRDYADLMADMMISYIKDGKHCFDKDGDYKVDVVSWEASGLDERLTLQKELRCVKTDISCSAPNHNLESHDDLQGVVNQLYALIHDSKILVKELSDFSETPVAQELQAVLLPPNTLAGIEAMKSCMDAVAAKVLATSDRYKL